MSDGCFPTRVLLLNDDIYCKDVNRLCRGKVEAGLSSRDKGRWSNTWCFCDDGVSMTHCHLFEQLITTDEKCYKHVAGDERSNGRTQSSVRRCLLLDDKVQLATVTCSYAIPSSVESLDLAVSSLQRMSGKYFVSQKLPCMMSVCGCNRSTKNAVGKEQSLATTVGSTGRSNAGTESRKKWTRKLHQSDLHSETLTDEKLSTDAAPSARCTRSVAKQLRDSCNAAVALPSAVDASTHASNVHTVAKQLRDSCSATVALPSAVDVSVHASNVHTDTDEHCTLLQTHTEAADKLQLTTAVNSAERRTRSAAAAAAAAAATAAAAAAAACYDCDADSSSLNTVISDTCKSLSKYRPRQKVIVNKKETKHSEDKLCNEMSLSSSQPVMAHSMTYNKQLRCSDANSGGVRTRQSHCSSESTENTAITAQCEVLVSRLSCSTQSSKQQVRAVSTDNLSSATESTLRSQLIIQSEAHGDCSELCALSVDVSFDCDGVCSSPASPLPVSVNMQHPAAVPRTARSVTAVDDLSCTH